MRGAAFDPVLGCFFFNLSTAFSSVAFSNNRVNLTTAPEVKVGVYSMLLFGDVKHAN